MRKTFQGLFLLTRFIMPAYAQRQPLQILEVYRDFRGVVLQRL
jgi:hypothetical protein